MMTTTTISDSFRRCVFDLEADGLLDTASRVHCLCLMDADTGKSMSCHTDAELERGLAVLKNAEELIGHNIICYDLRVLNKLYHTDFSIFNSTVGGPRITDTLVCTRLIYPDLKNDDCRLKPGLLPLRLYGRHSLEAWGYRLGEYKGEFGKTTDWKEWSPEMQSYCEQDVKVTLRLYRMIEAKNYPQGAIDLENHFRYIIQLQEEFGFSFDKEGAVELYGRLVQKRDDIKRQLQEAFPAKEEGEYFTPKRDNRTRGYVAGVPVFKSHLVEFNPSSRQHIADRLREKYGWKPEAYTEQGTPVVDEEVLSSLTSQYPEAALLNEFLMLNKRIGQLAEGRHSWLNLLDGKDGRIHGSVNTNGAVTGRCTHSCPNVAQVPAVGVPYGAECRALFKPPDGYYQLGCDASGLELRCLAHYMTRYDGGAYRDVILHGDIHTTNMKAAGLTERSKAKTMIYALLYGAGDTHLGSIIDPSLTDDAAKTALGKKIKKKFLSQTPALAQLINDVQRVAKRRKYLIGIDGRLLPVRSEHSALNTLLQSAGAVVMKKATCILWDNLKAHLGFTFGVEVAQMAHVHDEYQLAVRNDIQPEVVGELAVGAIRDAGTFFNFRCPLDGEYKTGANWAECH